MTQPLLAHGLTGRTDLPVPLEMFYGSSSIILVASFILLATLWSSPRWTTVPARPAPGWLQAIAASRPLAWLGRLLVLAALVLVLVAAAAGTREIGDNVAPLIIFVIWWIGLVPASLLLGDLWRALNPWATLARLAGFRESTGAAPRGLGVWPATLGLLVFAWLELVYPTASNVRLLAAIVAVYSLATIAGMSWLGVREWLNRGETFSVYSRLLATMSPWECHRDPAAPDDAPAQLRLRAPFIGALNVPSAPGLVTFIVLLIGTVSYDGLSRTTWWVRRGATGVRRMGEVGLEPGDARIVLGTMGLFVMCGIAWIAFELACVAAARLGKLRGDARFARTAEAFAPSLLPIAVAYVVAHYFSFFWFQSQDLIRLASDPLGRGSDFFGTADHVINYSQLSANLIWYVQVGAIVVGHVLGLLLAHERALELAPDRRHAVRSQVAMLGLMVLYTVGGLYFLSEGMTG